MNGKLFWVHQLVPVTYISCLIFRLVACFDGLLLLLLVVYSDEDVSS